MRALTMILSLLISLQLSFAQDQFVRGDSNASGDMDISDPIHTLLFLFTNSGTIGCEKAADANNDGELDIADPLKSLMFLYGSHPMLQDLVYCDPNYIPNEEALEEIITNNGYALTGDITIDEPVFNQTLFLHLVKVTGIDYETDQEITFQLIFDNAQAAANAAQEGNDFLNQEGYVGVYSKDDYQGDLGFPAVGDSYLWDSLHYTYFTIGAPAVDLTEKLDTVVANNGYALTGDVAIGQPVFDQTLFLHLVKVTGIDYETDQEITFQLIFDNAQAAANAAQEGNDFLNQEGYIGLYSKNDTQGDLGFPAVGDSYVWDSRNYTYFTID